ncbi:MAG: molybdopterin synthase sulfur carrier subunit [Gammaproteobacteria bacterium]|jgi:molybdopterin synthase sulfur carrier subunit
MSIKVKLFASLAESVGRREATFDYCDGMTVGSLWEDVCKESSAAPTEILAAVNMAYCEPETGLRDGDEVAFFPPVTGG